MHLARGLTTTSTKKRETKITKAQQEEFERGWRERNIRLKKINLPKETFEQYMEFVYGKGKKAKGQTPFSSKSQKAFTTDSVGIREVVLETNGYKNTNSSSEKDKIKISNSNTSRWITGPCSSKPSPVYTGDRVVGIATMHKSNAVPIFSDTEAKEVSSMRR